MAISFYTEVPMKYGTYLGDYPPYEAGKTCMCQIQHYAMEFDYLPAASNIYVYNGNGAELSFNGPLDLDNDGTNEAIQIPASYIHQNIYIGFNPVLVPSPELERAGGMCMIENLSSPREPKILTTYLEEERRDPAGNLLGIDYLIPANSANATAIIP